MTIVIALENPLRGEPTIRLVEPGEDGGEGSRPMPIEESLITALEERLDRLHKAGDQEALVKEIGEHLLKVLNCHPSIAKEVKQKLDLNHIQEEPIYLYFRHRIQKLERWPWETLYAPNVGFVSQNKKFAIARSHCCSKGKTEWLFEPPLKIMAVLGASGSETGDKVPGVFQWEGLRKAIEDSVLPVELRVLTCQRSLMDGINRQRLGWVRADLIPPSKPAAEGHTLPSPGVGMAPRDLLFEYIAAYKPHILHLFCHAGADPVPQLQVATYSDWEDAKAGSIVIDGKQLKQRADPAHEMWMVTLNCCDSARDGPGTSSLSIPVAAALASEGIPAVVGMREQIPNTFADAFSRLFYGALLVDFQERVNRAPADDGLVDIHWACGLFTIRQMAANGADGDVLDWTLPVMHTSYDFKLRVKGRARRPRVTGTTKRSTGGVRPGAKKQVLRPQPPRNEKSLSRREVAELEDELLQLYEDLKLVSGSPASKAIRKRIQTINRHLSNGVRHAEPIPRGTPRNQRV
jgi:hypothetical protein